MSIISLKRSLTLTAKPVADHLSSVPSERICASWKQSGQDGGRVGSRDAEGRSGWGPDVLPVGEECRGRRAI